MTVPLRFDVLGTPAPQGSKRHVCGGRMVERIAAWEDCEIKASVWTKAENK